MLAAALGWMGTAGTFGAYLLLWRGRVTSDSLTYALLNTVGGVLAGLASAWYGAWPSVASNAVWAAIGAHTVASTVLGRRRATLVALPPTDEAPELARAA